MRKVGICFALVAALALAACGGHSPTAPTPPAAGGGTPPPQPPPPPPPPPVLAQTTFLAFGDSLTEGVFGTEVVRASSLTAGSATAYPYQLQSLLATLYTGQTVTIWNAGKSGERAADAGPRLDSALSESQPQVLLLLEGINDIGSGASIQTATNRVEDLVRAALYRHVIVMVATYPPERPGPSTQPGVPARGDNAAKVQPFNASLKQMAINKGAMVVDLYPNVDVSLIGPDGLHPTAAGYARMAQVFYDAINATWQQPPVTAMTSAPARGIAIGGAGPLTGR